jgi:lysophospholipase L1-like esterase
VVRWGDWYKLTYVLCCLLSTSALLSTYHEEFAAFAEQEKRGAVPHRPVLFYGSSSFRLWEQMTQAFPGLPVLNRGFGGSTLEECVALMERWVYPVEPRAIVLYAGDNDLDHGASPEEVLARFEAFCSGVRARLGWVPLLFVSIKPSPARFWNVAKIAHANQLVQDAITSRWREAHYVDIYHPMLKPDGSPRHELYTEDGLHMNSAGYELWRDAIRGALADIGLQGEARVP